MSVSIDIYRSRIGTFLSDSRNVENRYCRRSSRKIKNINPVIRSFKLVFFILVSCALTHLTTQRRIYTPVKLPHQGNPVQPPPPVPQDNNFHARYKFGNKGRKRDGITIMHWNKGLSILENKMEEIAAIIDKYRPMVLGLSEANLRRHDDISKVQLKDYKLHTCPTMDNPAHRVSRVVVYTHKSIIAKLRPDLMDPGLSTIWLEVGVLRSKKFLL